MNLEHRTETLPSGSVVHVWSAPSAPVGLVQLQHGYAEYAERYIDEYRRLIPQLVDRGYEVWALDMHGHGRSPGRRAITDVRQAVVEHRVVRSRMRGSTTDRREVPIVLIGHSLGGLVTAASVAEDAAEVRQVILTSPVILSRTPPPVRLAARAVSTLAPGAHVPGKAARLTHDAAVAERAAADPLMYHGTTTLRVGSTALDVADGLWRSVGEWTTPLTILHGTSDDATAYDRSAAFIAALDRPDATLLTFGGGFHELLHDMPGDDTALNEVLALLDGAAQSESRAGRAPRKHHDPSPGE